MLKKETVVNNENGFVLVASLLILLILLIIGVAATNTSTIELQIAANEKIHQQTFYQADGGAELASRVTFENAMCVNSGGFSENPASSGKSVIGNLEVLNLDFASPTSAAVQMPSDTTRDLVYYSGSTKSDSAPHSNMTITGKTTMTAGSGLNQVAGYDGLGKSAAAGGTHVRYFINSQHKGVDESESLVGMEWKLSTYLINSASSDDCEY